MWGVMSGKRVVCNPWRHSHPVSSDVYGNLKITVCSTVGPRKNPPSCLPGEESTTKGSCGGQLFVLKISTFNTVISDGDDDIISVIKVSGRTRADPPLCFLQSDPRGSLHRVYNGLSGLTLCPLPLHLPPHLPSPLPCLTIAFTFASFFFLNKILFLWNTFRYAKKLQR